MPASCPVDHPTPLPPCWPVHMPIAPAFEACPLHVSEAAVAGVVADDHILTADKQVPVRAVGGCVHHPSPGSARDKITRIRHGGKGSAAGRRVSF